MYDLGFVRFPEFVAADALDYPELLRRAVRRGAWIHTTSDFVRDEVDRDVRGARRAGRARLPGRPADRRAATPPAATRSREPTRYVLAVGTIEPRKNYPTLVRAFDALAADDPTSCSSSPAPAGGAATRSTPPLAAAHHRDRVCTLGYVSADDRRDLLAGASVLAYPSHYEGFGFPPLEAMAAGVPVVATRAGAMPEVVGDAALLVDPDDVDALADACSTVLTDDDTRRDLVARGRARHAGFSWAQTVDELLDLYRSGALVKAVVTGARGFVGRHLTPAPRRTRRRGRVARRRRLAAGRHHRSRRGRAPHRRRVARRRVPPRGAQPRRCVVDRRRRAHRR